jgi:hypothetical protein
MLKLDGCQDTPGSAGTQRQTGQPERQPAVMAH